MKPSLAPVILMMVLAEVWSAKPKHNVEQHVSDDAEQHQKEVATATGRTNVKLMWWMHLMAVMAVGAAAPMVVVYQVYAAAAEAAAAVATLVEAVQLAAVVVQPGHRRCQNLQPQVPGHAAGCNVVKLHHPGAVLCNMTGDSSGSCGLTEFSPATVWYASTTDSCVNGIAHLVKNSK